MWSYGSSLVPLSLTPLQNFYECISVCCIYNHAQFLCKNHIMLNVLLQFPNVNFLLLNYRRDQGNSRLPRSSSIDSMVEAVWSDSPRLSLAVPQYSQNTQLVPPTNSGSNSRRESLSPSASRRSKQNRGITGESHHSFLYFNLEQRRQLSK